MTPGPLYRCKKLRFDPRLTFPSPKRSFLQRLRVRRELLPAVLPIVLYNGQRALRAAKELDLLREGSSPGLAPYRVQARYLLIDEQRFARAQLPLRNLVAALFRLEQARSEQDCAQVIGHLCE